MLLRASLLSYINQSSRLADHSQNQPDHQTPIELNTYPGIPSPLAPTRCDDHVSCAETTALRSMDGRSLQTELSPRPLLDLHVLQSITLGAAMSGKLSTVDFVCEERSKSVSGHVCIPIAKAFGYSLMYKPENTR